MSRILLVEDNPADRALVRLGFEVRGSDAELDFATTGGEALERLRAAAAGGAPAPDLVVLDVNLPGLTGHEVLGAAREERLLDSTPVVFFSTSDAPDDLERAERLGAVRYFVKPDRLEQLLAVLAEMEDLARG